MSISTDRNLLFGLLAVQNGFISRDALHRAFNAWMQSTERPLGDVLTEQHELNADERQYLDALTDRYVLNHNGEPKRSLASINAAEVAAALGLNGETNVPASDACVSSATGDDVVSSAPPESDGRRFSVLRPHARGGLGQVHIAFDRELHREVALKELLSHVADSEEARRRFMLEADITSRLEHPGIVPMYGLGVGADGKPYYVMRLIRGETLQQAIDELFGKSESKDFDGERRRQLHHMLRQFITVCQTVAYAHTRGIIHRDLKPANVVLGDYGETFVVDWGLAKVVGSEENNDSDRGPSRSDADSVNGPRSTAPKTLPAAVYTQAGQILGTPAFMSPEQADGRWDQLGPASDIYSLGAVLFSILTGRPPCAGESKGVLERVRSGSLSRPRQVNPAVPAALDAVCVKALAVNPGDRYAAATDLAADIDRWLADEPVTAWREPLLTRLGRWVRRHRSWVAAAAALMVTAVFGLAAGLFFVDRERRETSAERQKTQVALDETVLQRQRTREALDEMTSGATSDWLSTQKELLPSQKQFLERALAYYQDFARESADDPAGRALLAKARFRVASMLDKLGRYADAEPSYRAAVADWESLSEAFPSVADYRRDLANSYNNLGTLLSRQGNKSGAETAYRMAINLREKLAAQMPTSADCHNDIAETYNNLALLQSDVGNKAEAEATYRKALAVYDKLAADFPTADYRRQMALCINGLGVLLKNLRRNDEAVVCTRRAIEVQATLAAEFPDVPEHRGTLALFHNSLGNVLANLGKAADADTAYRRALEVQEQLVADYPVLPTYRQSLAKGYNNLAIAAIKLGKPADAEAAYRRALSIHEKLVADFPNVPDHQRELALGLHNLAILLRDTGKKPEGEACYRRAVTILEPLVAAFPASADYRGRLADSSINLGMALKDRGEMSEALELLTQGIELFEPLVGQDANLIREKKRLCAGYEVRAAAYHRLQRYSDAVADWDRAIAADGKSARPSQHIGRALSLVRSGDHATATAAAEVAVTTAGASAADFFFAARVISIAAGANSGDAAQAERLARRAVELLRESAGRGYKNTKQWKDDADLAPLRERDDFKKLLAELDS
jgi:eukaryotic-like serine/threonine-protein kinase